MIILRPRIIRVIRIVSTSIFGTCSCGDEILYFSDYGVKCISCGKLYATWSDGQPNGHKGNWLRPNYMPEDYSSSLVDVKQDDKAIKYPIVPYKKHDLMLIG